MHSKKLLGLALVSSLGLGLLLSAPPASAAANGHALKCHMSFTLTGWSAAYETANGTGTVTCNNGKSMRVALDVKGGGLSVGKYKINDGRGDFTGIKSIHDVLGDYAMANAHAGVVKSSRAAVMTKGSVSLAISGTGNGWDIGAGFAGFMIKPLK